MTANTERTLRGEVNSTMNKYDTMTPRPFYVRWLDDLGDDYIRFIDLVESGHDEDAVAEFGFSSMTPDEQAVLMYALEAHLSPVKRITKRQPRSYSIMMAARYFVGHKFHVSDLAVRTCLRLIGYRCETRSEKYPRYNVSLRSWRAFTELAEGFAPHQMGWSAPWCL